MHAPSAPGGRREPALSGGLATQEVHPEEDYSTRGRGAARAPGELA